MRQPVIKRPRRAGFNMTPMIDVVFLLIIFFLVSSHLARRETLMQLDLPVAESADPENQVVAPRLTINVSRDGSVLIAGRPAAGPELARRMALAKQDLGNGMEVRIRSSRLTPWSDVEPVMTACTKNGIWNVSWAVYREER